MRNVFPVPKELKNRIESVSDNRQPGDEIILDPQLFVEIFREDLDEWLTKRQSKQAGLQRV